MRRRRRAREEQEKRENRRPILQKLCAALLQSFMGHHGEKIKGSVRGNLDPTESQQPFQTNQKRGRGPDHHVETAVDWCGIGHTNLATQYSIGHTNLEMPFLFTIFDQGRKA